MAGLITHTGILEIQQNIALKEGTLKARLLDAIVSYFPDDDSLLNTAAIPPDELVKKVWETEDPAEIKIKRKNLSSLKSSLNKSLKQLDKDGKNPEGIILGRDNVFIISDERKNDLLRQMGLAGEAPKTVQEMLQAFKTIFSDILKEQGLDGVSDLLKELDETKKTVRSLAGLPPEKEPEAADPGEAEKGAAVPAAPEAGEGQGQGPLPEPEPGPGEAGAAEIIEPAESEELEEVVEEEALALPEEVEEIEEIAEEDLLEEEILPPDEAEEIEEVPAAADETLPETGPEDRLEEAGPAEIIELAAGEELEEVDEEEAPALPEEIAEEDLLKEDLLEEEILPPEEMEEVEEVPAAAGEALPEAGPEDWLEEAGPTEIIELVAGEELEELEEVDEEEAPALPEEIEEIEEISEEDLQEEEILESDETEEIEEVDEEEAPALPEESAEIEEIAEEDLLEEEILESEETVEVEEVDEEEATALPEEIAEEDLLEEDLLEEEILESEETVEVEEVPAAAGAALPETGPEDWLEEAGPTETIELAAGEELEEVDEEEAPALPEEIAEIEEISEEDLLEEEILESEETEEVEEVPAAAGEALPETGPEDWLEKAGPTEIIELAAGEELEEIEEVDKEEAPALPEEIGESEKIAEENLLAEELLEEEILESEAVEELAEDEIETLPEAQLEEAEGEETIELAEGEELEEVDEEEHRQPTPLDILSKYLEATEALSQGADLLKESGEEYTAQLLDRFMPKFIKIPEGTYTVGSNTPKTLEQLQKIIRIKGFYLGQFPVTNDLFEFFVRETGYVSSAEAAGYGIVFEGRCSRKIDPQTGRESMTLTSGTTARHVIGANWRHPAGPGSSLDGKHNHPVVQVSHDDAMAFAAWAGKRLPSEEEWEAAARGKEGGLFPWGNIWLATLGNFEAACLGESTAVDHHGPQSVSPFGIYDLLGNVLEWTSTPYSQKTSGDPIYILKGGCWTSGGVITASARRIETRKYWSNTIGFRCAVSESKRRR